jgi:uncharacterized iron-regulated protein
MLPPLLLACGMISTATLPPGCLIVEARDGRTITLEEAAEDLARRDVVFLGEDHDSQMGHQAQLAIAQAIHARHKGVILSLEMFERDVQGLLDDYVRGRIDEAAFLKQARPWKDYQTHYRPLIEWAKGAELDILAANVPRAAAKAVSDGETPEPRWAPFLPRSTTVPEDAYWQRFQAAMKGHVGAEGSEALRRYYAAQCLKDDAMAETIADALARNGHRRMIVIHLCGKFHSDFGEGTAKRVLTRRPLTQMAVLTMEGIKTAEQDITDARQRGHYVVAVPTKARNE